LYCLTDCIKSLPSCSEKFLNNSIEKRVSIYGKGNRIPSGICWGSSEFLLHPIDGGNVRETPPLLTAGFETHPLRSGHSLPVSRSACVISSYASRYRTNLMYQPHISNIRKI
jgi:hypothetical protein